MNKEHYNTQDEYTHIAEQLVSVRVNSICGFDIKEFPNNGVLYEIARDISIALANEDKKEVKVLLSFINHRLLLNLLNEVI